MKKFIYKYNLEMLSVFLLAEAILTLAFRDSMSPGQIITGGFAFFIMLHEWEETRWPGGFFELMFGKMGVDLETVDMGKCHLPTKILIFMFALVPMIFHQNMILICVPIVTMLFEMFVHIMGIFLHRMKKPYTPGMVSAIAMGIWAIYSIRWLLGEGMATGLDIVIAAPIFFVCFFAMFWGITKLMNLDFKEARRNLMESVRNGK